LSSLTALATANCSGALSIADRPCPCADGFTCCEANQRCVPNGSKCTQESGVAAPPGPVASALADAGDPSVAVGAIRDGSVGDGRLDGSSQGFRTPITPGSVQCGNRPACEDPTPRCCGNSASAAGSCNSGGACTSEVVLECDG